MRPPQNTQPIPPLPPPKPTVEVKDVTLGYMVNALLNHGYDFPTLRVMKVTDILTEYEVLRIK